MNNKEKFLLIMGILNPIIYSISPNLIIISILIELIIIFSFKEEFYKRFWKMYLLSFTYFGMSILGIKIYDLVMMIFIPNILIYKKIKIDKKKLLQIIIIIFYFIYITVILIINDLNLNAISEYTRYIQSFILFLVVLKTITDFKQFTEIFKFFEVIAFKTMLTGIIMAILSMKDLIQYNYTNSVFSMDIYNISSELRVTGFFSDPNKYCMFFIVLLIIYEFYCYTQNSRKIIDRFNLKLIIPIIMSFSRMGLFTIALYFILKVINVKLLKMNKKLIYMFNFAMILASSVIIIFFKSQVLEFINEIIYKTTKFLGRESTLRYSFDLVNDSRVIASKIALESVKNNIFIGNGLSYWKSLYYMPPHNTFVSIIQDTGIIGCVLFSLMNMYSLKKIPLHILITLLLLPMVTLDLQNYRLLFMLIGLMTTVDNDNLNIRRSS